MASSPPPSPAHSSPLPPKKRRKASTSPDASPSTLSAVGTPSAQSISSPVSGPNMMPLPPPLMPYPDHRTSPTMAPHPFYYPFYHPPVYIPIHGASPPLPPTSPTPPGQQRRLLPKNPHEAMYYHPYAVPATSPTSTPQQQCTTADEREQARKVSHSAIERRRRERINDKIVQLRQLIPSCADQEHLHKMTVLQSAIDYISYLKEVVARLDGGDDRRVQVNLKMQKMPKSMLPKEVEPFTSQFSSRDKKSLKPMDVIKGGTMLPSSSSPSQQSQSDSHDTASWTPLPPPSIQPSSPATSSSSTRSRQDSFSSVNGPSSPSLPTPALTPRQNPPPHQQKHMSIENILC